ncbi:MAG: isopenicillin N synthase family oxygenase [Acidimicrobiia bacterium]|nr:isopenicillin N synthase family oxygenase [Acidimicrobiia bacterium]
MTLTETDLIPVLELGPFLAGAPGAEEDLSRKLQGALEEVGFFFVVDHGVDWRLVHQVDEGARRLHALEDEVKEGIPFGRNRGGYLRLGGGTSYASKIAGEVRKPNLNAAYFVHRERTADDPHVLAGEPFRGTLNQWPPEALVPGFRDAVLRYCEAMEALGRRLLPLYAGALELPPTFFDDKFDDAQFTLRMSHYPVVAHEEEQWGLAPHTDSGFMTLLPDNEVAGLEIRPEGHDWVRPPALAQSFLVNSGDTLRRWTNDRFLSTAHRVLNASGRDRYAIPFFYDPRVDVPIECLPTCVDAERPCRYEPTTYGEYLRWFMNRNYAKTTGEQAGHDAP